MKVFLVLGVLLSSTYFSQMDSISSFWRMNEIAIIGNSSVGENSLYYYGDFILASQRGNSIGVNYRHGLIHGKNIDTKISTELALQTVSQATSYTYFVTGVTSTHNSQLRTFAINVSPQFSFKLLKRNKNTLGIDLLPGASFDLLDINYPSIIYSDYQDPSLGFEIARFEIERESKVYPTIQLQLWSLIDTKEFGIKPFFGIRYAYRDTPIVANYPNGNSIGFYEYGVKKWYLNFGLAVVI